VAGRDGRTIVTPSIVMLVVIIGAFLVAVRRLLPDRLYLFQGMFRYEADLGWPHGVQEEDGERAWMAHERPAWDPEADEVAWADSVGTSTIVELDADRPTAAVTIVRVKADVSRARLPSEGAAVARRWAPRRRER
jgi:hypothetical protein